MIAIREYSKIQKLNKGGTAMNIKEIKHKISNSSLIAKNKDHQAGYIAMRDFVMGLLNQLDEPQKPVVPKFVADWFEDHKDDLEFSIWNLTIDSNANYTKDKKEMRHWIQYATNKPLKTLIAMLDGYEVEKEPLYYIYLPKIIVLPEMMIPDIEGAYLMKSGDEVELADNNDFDDMKFTESEIKAIDERYWAFAVPMEEVAEG